MVDSALWELQNLIVDLRWNGQPDWDESVIRPIVEQRPTILAFLHDVGRPEARGPLPGGDENLWDLYVLSRLTDILIAPHQPVNDDPALIAWTTKSRGGPDRSRAARRGRPRSRHSARPASPRTRSTRSSTRSWRSSRPTTRTRSRAWSPNTGRVPSSVRFC
jgi:hypothetical protein